MDHLVLSGNHSLNQCITYSRLRTNYRAGHVHLVISCEVPYCARHPETNRLKVSRSCNFTVTHALQNTAKQFMG